MLLVITSYLKFYYPLEIDVGFISINASSSTSNQTNDTAPDITIRLEILVQPPVEYPETEILSDRLLNTTSNNPRHISTDPLLVLLTAWEAHATPFVTGSTTT